MGDEFNRGKTRVGRQPNSDEQGSQPRARAPGPENEEGLSNTAEAGMATPGGGPMSEAEDQEIGRVTPRLLT